MGRLSPWMSTTKQMTGEVGGVVACGVTCETASTLCEAFPHCSPPRLTHTP